MIDQSMMEDLRTLLRHGDEFKAKWGFNAYDNYVWREYMVIDYMNQFYPTFSKHVGRHGEDSFCEELKLEKISIKSAQVRKRKTTNDYNLTSSIFFFDRQKQQEFRDRALSSDSYLFALFDAEHSGHPISVTFSHKPKDVDAIRELISSKQKEYLAKPDEQKNKRDTITVNYGEVSELNTEKYGAHKATLFEFTI
jgi:hypothetical protein